MVELMMARSTSTKTKDKVYEAVAHREPNWWVIDVAELDITTQARRLNEIVHNAREAIAVFLDVSMDDVKVSTTVEAPETVAQLLGRRAQAAAAQERAAEELEGTVENLMNGLGLTVREVGALTGMSHQRVAQVRHKVTHRPKQPPKKGSPEEVLPPGVVRWNLGRDMDIIITSTPA